MSEELADDYFSISLRIFGGTQAYGAWESLLVISASAKQTAGQRRQTPTGMLLEGDAKENLATFKMQDKITGDLAHGLAEVIERLQPHAARFAQLREEGGRCELFVGWAFREGAHSGDSFDYLLMRKLSELQIDLTLNVYEQDPRDG